MRLNNVSRMKWDDITSHRRWWVFVRRWMSIHRAQYQTSTVHEIYDHSPPDPCPCEDIKFLKHYEVEKRVLNQQYVSGCEVVLGQVSERRAKLWSCELREWWKNTSTLLRKIGRWLIWTFESYGKRKSHSTRAAHDSRRQYSWCRSEITVGRTHIWWEDQYLQLTVCSLRTVIMHHTHRTSLHPHAD